MNRAAWIRIGIVGLLGAWACASPSAGSPWEVDLRYPETRISDHADTLHGRFIADPYRWLEDLAAPETQDWMRAQQELAESVLAQIPERDRIRDRLTQVWDHARVGLPTRRGNLYYTSRNDGLQEQSVLIAADRPAGEGRIVLDPNLFSEDGTVALEGTSISEDGRWLAYGVSTAGSDWSEWRVRDLRSGEDLPDRIPWVKFSGAAWTHDHLGFFYSRYDPPAEREVFSGVNEGQKLYYHRLGDDAGEDRLIYERPDQKEWGFGSSVTEDGAYLVLQIWRGSDRKNAITIRDLRDPSEEFQEFLHRFDARYSVVGNEGCIFWVETDLDAPLGRMIAIDLRDPAPEHWRTMIPEAAEPLRGVSLVGDRFFASYLRDAHTVVRIFDLNGAPVGEVDLPGIGSAYGFYGRKEDRETFYLFTSFTEPSAIYRYDLDRGASDLVHRPESAPSLDGIETSQIFYASADGTRIPMFLVHREGIELDGSHPVYLTGYGGFGIPMSPRFSAAYTVWLEMGGIVAIPGLRGGGEYGKEWHDAGKREKKQNTFDDFIAAAEWLIARGYTTTERLAIGGGSNGGLLVGACLTQRPDLFGAAVPSNGVLDMLRFHRFTIGWAWVSDYGSPDDPEQFETLLRYSPLHNARPGVRYPPTLIATADHDDRVVPAHSTKFGAALQGAQAGPAPILIRVQSRAGHGGGMPTSMRIAEQADLWAFLVRALGFTPRWSR